jgi:DUF4097 and DUF4098 domain-containing protein YvlB
MPSRCKTLCSLLVLLLAFTAAAAAKVSREDLRTFPLSPAGRLSLDNVNGDVTIEGWDRDEVSVETVIRAETQQSLDEVTVSIDAGGDRIHIETVYPDRHFGRREAAIVDYTIHMPRGARLDGVDLVNGSLSLSGLGGDVKAELVNGRATARNLAGNVEISTVNGSLDVALDELAAGQAIELESVNGSLDLAVPGRADAEIRAETVHGRIRNDFGLEEEKDEYVGSSLSGTLGRGGARVELENVNGSIDIRLGS